MKINSESIKAKAIELGFHKVGIAKAASIQNEKNKLEAWLSDNKHADMAWMEKRKKERGDIHAYFNNAKSIISVGLNYNTGYKQKDINSKYKFSNYAWGDDYHDIVKGKLYKLLKWVKENKVEIKGLVCSDTSPVMDKVWSQRAGIGWLGKHTKSTTKD